MRVASLATLLFPSALVLAGCVEESAAWVPEGDDQLAEAASPIVGGARDDAHPAVVALTVQHQAFCSGTLVAPTVVVTAAHCLHRDFVDDFAIEGVQVFFGATVKGPGTSIDVAEIVLHPEFRSDDPEQDDDVAVLRLATEAPVAPMAIGRSPEAGATLTLVGYGRGRSDQPETGVRRSGTSTVDLVTDALMVLRAGPHDTCKGDSGGAAIATMDGVETLVGVHTRSDCATGMIEERVDAHFDDFLRPFLGTNVPCVGCGADGGEGEGGGGGAEPVEDDLADEEEADAPSGAACSLARARPSRGACDASAAAVMILGSVLLARRRARRGR